jgi:hypothetical protein
MPRIRVVYNPALQDDNWCFSYSVCIHPKTLLEQGPLRMIQSKRQEATIEHDAIVDVSQEVKQ